MHMEIERNQQKKMHVNLYNYVIHIKRLRNDGNMLCAYRAALLLLNYWGLAFRIERSEMMAFSASCTIYAPH